MFPFNFTQNTSDKNPKCPIQSLLLSNMCPPFFSTLHLTSFPFITFILQHQQQQCHSKKYIYVKHPSAGQQNTGRHNNKMLKGKPFVILKAQQTSEMLSYLPCSQQHLLIFRILYQELWENSLLFLNIKFGQILTTTTHHMLQVKGETESCKKINSQHVLNFALDFGQICGK